MPLAAALGRQCLDDDVVEVSTYTWVITSLANEDLRQWHPALHQSVIELDDSLNLLGKTMIRWDSPTFNGVRGDWYWFVSRQPITDLLRLVVQEHFGHRLWITTFDSGPITPNPDEMASGWKIIDGAMISPPLFEDIEIPHDQYDEWYIFPDDRPRFHDLERFVNYGGFNLADPRAMAASFDPTWDRSALDWLYPIQDQFWKQLENLSPLSYIASGESDVIVTRLPAVAQLMRRVLDIINGEWPNGSENLMWPGARD